MADVNANIGVHIDTTGAISQLKALQRELATFHSSVNKSSSAAALAQKNLQTNLLNSINSTGKFYAQMGLVRSSTESFTHALEKNHLSMREYFRYAGGASRTFGKMFRQEFDTIGKVAQDRVRRMQTQYIKMGRDASGAVKAMSVTPATLDMKNYGNQLAVAAQKQAILNQLLKQGSTNLLNFGKNTQWAGRQLMVGFSIPLAYFGTAASKTFIDLEKQAIRFKRVYGDMFTTTDETNKALDDIKRLAEEFTKYGVAVKDTMSLAADAAAMGKTGADLTAQVAQATRLAVLGGIEQQKALETTMSVTNAFGISADELASKMNFLNAVENQTVVSIDDLTEAIPKAGPVVKQLGGSVEDLALFLTAMKEGGINASEGANALKSGLASLINPTKKASEMLLGMGISIKAIVEKNAGNLRETVVDFAAALDTLSPLQRARAIEQLFGKFQFARLSTLFQNVAKDGTQAARVLDLIGASTEELAILAERELGTVENAVGINFKEAVEKLKVAIAPIGKTFLEAVTPIAKALSNIFDKFNNLSDGTKKFIVVATTLVGILGPVLLMTFGLLANGVANIIKLFVTMRGGFLRITGNTTSLAESTRYLNQEQLEAATVAASLGQSHTRLTQQFTLETAAVNQLTNAYINATLAANRFAAANPGMMMPGFKGVGKGFTPPKKFADGIETVTGGIKGKDSVAALLTPGEAVVPEPIAQNEKYKPLVQALVTGDIAQYNDGTVFAHAVDSKEVKPSARSKLFGVNTDRFYTSVGFNIDGSINQAMTGKGNGVSKERYIKALQNDLSLTTMTGQLIRAGVQPNQAAETAKSIRSSLIKELENNKNLTIVKDADVYKVMGNLNKGVLGKLYKNPTMGRGIKNLFTTGKTTSGTTPELSKVLKKSNITKSPAELIAYLKNKPGIQQTTLRSLERLQEANPNYKIQVLEKDGKILAYRRPEVDPDTLKISDKKFNLAAVDNNGKFQFLSESANRGRQIKISDALRKRAQAALISPTEAVLRGTGKVDTRTTSKAANERAVGPFAGVQDTRRTILYPGDRVIKRPIGGQAAGRMAAFRMMGLQDYPGQIDTRGMSMSEIQKQIAIARGRRKQSEKLLKEQTYLTKQQNKLMREQIAAQQQKQLTPQELRRANIAARAQKIGKVTNPIAAVAGTASMGAFMTGNAGAGMGLMGLSALASLGPSLANPYVAAAAAVAVTVGGFYALNKSLEQAAKKQAEFVESTSATTKKMNQVGQITGKVGASELMAKKRQTGPFGAYNDIKRAGTMFGDTFLQSDIGKSIVNSFTKNMEQYGAKQAASDFALQLAAYVSDGVLNAEQANSIAEQIGIQLGNQRYTVQIQGDLKSLIGVDGEDLLKNPMKIRTQIVQATEGKTTRAVEALKTIDNTDSARTRTAAQIAALSVNTLEIIKAQQDAQNAMYNKQVELLQKQLIQTKDLEKQRDLKQQIVDLQSKQTAENKQFNTMFSKQIDKEIQTYKENIASGLTGGTLTEGAYFDSLKSMVKDTYKGTAYEKLAETALKNLAGTSGMFKGSKGFKSRKEGQAFEIQMSLLMKNKVLNPEQVNSLLNLFDGNLPQLQETLKLGIEIQGAEKTAAMLDFFISSGVKKEKAMTLVTQITKSDPKTFDEIGETLASLQALDGHEINMAAYLETDDAYTKLVALSKKLAAIEKIPSPITKEALLDLYNNGKLADTGVTKTGLETLFKQWNDFNKLPDVMKKEAISKFITILDTQTTPGSEDRANQVKEMMKGRGRTAAKEYQRLLNMSAEEFSAIRAKTYLGDIKPPNQVPQGGGDTTGAGKAKSELEDLLLQYKLLRDASVNAEGGIVELNRIIAESNGDLTKFVGLNKELRLDAIGQPFIDWVGGLEEAVKKKYITIAADGVTRLTDAGEKVKKVYDAVTVGSFVEQTNKASAEMKAQTEQFLRLKELGVDAADAIEILGNEDLSAALRTQGYTQVTEEFINSLKERKSATEENLKITKPEEYFKTLTDKAMDYYDTLEREAKSKYQPQIDAVNELIDANEKLIDTKQRDIELKYNRPIQALQDQTTILNHDLSLIDKAAEAINAKYDSQEAALNKISEINQQIAEQEKGRLDIASALSRGDVAAAADAAQQLSATSAQNALQSQSGILTAARQAEIDSLRNAAGLTRKQIEEKIYNISEQIYQLEQAQLPLTAEITALQDQNYQIQKSKLEPLQQALNKELQAIDAQRQKWSDTQLAIDGAKVRTKEFNDAMTAGQSIIEKIKGLWDGIKDKTVTLTTVQGTISGANTGLNSSTTGNLGSSSSRISQRVGDLLGLGLASGGYVPKYMARGGRMGSDSVPAMLTPGEFVVNRFAARRFGPLLESLNESKYPSMLTSSLGGNVIPISNINSKTANNSTAMYTYNLGFNISGNNLKPSDISKAVINEIKQVDRQRIRGIA